MYSPALFDDAPGWNARLQNRRENPPAMHQSHLAQLLAISIAASFAPDVEAAPERDCFWHLERGRDKDIACEFPTRLTEEEKSDLRRITRDMLQDAHCVVSIRIERKLVNTALSERDLIFQSPEQSVRCEIVTRDGVIPILGTFAPRVVFVDGRATEATPGLAKVTGVSSVLAWPVVQYVNRSETIRAGMLTVINGYRAHRLEMQTYIRKR